MSIDGMVMKKIRSILKVMDMEMAMALEMEMEMVMVMVIMVMDEYQGVWEDDAVVVIDV